MRVLVGANLANLQQVAVIEAALAHHKLQPSLLMSEAVCTEATAVGLCAERISVPYAVFKTPRRAWRQSGELARTETNRQMTRAAEALLIIWSAEDRADNRILSDLYTHCRRAGLKIYEYDPGTV